MTSWLAHLIPFADAWSMHDSDVGFGWWLVMMLVFWGGLIALMVWLLRGGAWTSRSTPSQPEATPREILDQRLADGSLSVEEYQRRRDLLDEARNGVSKSRQATTLGGEDR